MDRLHAIRLQQQIIRDSDSITVLALQPWRKTRVGHSWQLVCLTDSGLEFRVRSERQWAQWRAEMFGEKAAGAI